jgi:hypothetical protein
MALSVMNRIAKAIPAHAEVENPFQDDWQTLERVALVSILSQLKVRTPGEKMNIQELRPGAFWQLPPNTTEVNIIIPQVVQFDFLKTFLNTKVTQIDGGTVASFKDGDMMVTCSKQPGADGIVSLMGEKTTIGKTMMTGAPTVKTVQQRVLIISQSKKQEDSGVTGKASGAVLYDGSLESTILPKMRDVATAFKKKYEDFNRAFVIYDVFSDRIGPKKDQKPFQVTDTEAIVVTRSETLDSVLGGLALRKRAIVL